MWINQLFICKLPTYVSGICLLGKWIRQVACIGITNWLDFKIHIEKSYQNEFHFGQELPTYNQTKNEGGPVTQISARSDFPPKLFNKMGDKDTVQTRNH